MMRFLLILAVITVAVMVSPPLRTRAIPYVEYIARPAFRMYTNWRLDEIARLVENEIRSGREPPGRRSFTAFLDRAYLGEASTNDPWGTPYFLQPEPFGVRVCSAGPDRRAGTDDDLHSRLIATGRVSYPE